MNEQVARDLYRGMCGAIDRNEFRRAIGEAADDAHVMTLAQHVIEAIDALPEQGKTMLRRRELAEAVIDVYKPIPFKPAQEPRAYTILDTAFASQ